MKLKVKNSESLSHLEISEEECVHCNIVSNDCQHDSRALYIFIPETSFGKLLDISPEKLSF